MRHKVLDLMQILTMVVCLLLAVVSNPRLARAGGGIVLQLPFNGTYRITAYFDHDTPRYCSYADGYNWIYNGERVTSSCANQTGEPYPYDGHNGVDWSMGTGTAVLASADGEVIRCDPEHETGGYGIRLRVQHANEYETWYTHLNQCVVTAGHVDAGQLIALSGDTGNVDAHLHFTVLHSGNPTDPFGWRGSYQDPLVNFPTTGAGETASCLWAGVPGDDVSCTDVIVEDDGTGWEQYPSWDKNCWESGSWQRCDKGNGFRYHWTDVWDPADFWVTWRPWYEQYGQLRYPGYYQIHAFVPAAGDSSKTKTSNARYEVHYGYYYNETTIVPVNQAVYNNRWVSLGRYWLWPGQMGSCVSMDDYTGESSGSRKIVADSMKFSASIVHLPDVRNAGGWASSIIIRNNSASSAQVAINYYNSSGGYISEQTTTIASNGSKTRTPPSGWTGSARVTVTDGQPLVGTVNQMDEASGSYRAGTYSGIAGGSRTVVLPYLPRNDQGWSASLTIQNLGSSSTDVTIDYYEEDGTEHSYGPYSIEAGESEAWYLPNVGGLPDGRYSAAVTSDGEPIGGISNAIDTSVSGDGFASYNGSNR